MATRPRTQPNLERAVLDNGLTVIAVPDRSVPFVGVSVVYDVGFRSEPEGRTGFAHLFEHLMFQGSAHVGKVEHMRLIESAGGVMNGHTLPDVTAYYEALPPSGVELACYLEADRMQWLAVTEENLHNQTEVVKEEIRVNVLNRPYGGFPWIPLPALAFDRYPNAHNGYGDFTDLEHATVADAEDFYARYYAPSNAVLAVVGDCKPEEVVAAAERYFGAIPWRAVPDRGPWPEEPLAEDRRKTIEDHLAPQPALAIGYRTPDPVGALDRYLAYYLLTSVLAAGDASRLRSRLVHRDHSVTDVSCGLATFGDDALFSRDPVLFQVIAYYPATTAADGLLKAIDEELTKLAEDGLRPGELERVVATELADHWRSLDSVLDRSHTLASIEAVHGRAELIDELADKITAISPADLTEAAADLVAQHRVVVELRPGGPR